MIIMKTMNNEKETIVSAEIAGIILNFSHFKQSAGEMC